MKQEMSVTRALAEVQTLKNNIDTMSRTGMFIGFTVGKGKNKKVVNSSLSVENFSSMLQGEKDKLENMFARYRAIKAALVMSNATTFVTVNGTSMTVAEAIELKTSITNKEQLIRALQVRVNKVNDSVNMANRDLTLEIDKALAVSYGADKAKISESTYEAISAPKRDMQEAAVLDPVNVLQWIEQLQKEVEAVKVELNFTLSESNARNMITIDV